MLRRVRRLFTLSGAERWLLLRAFAALTTTDIALRIHGFQRLVDDARSAGAPRRRVVGREELLRAMRYAHWLEVASRYHLVGVRCLHRSITLHSWLLREGLPSQIRLGVRKEGSELKAHAWVEVDGYVVSDEPGAITQFKPLMGRMLDRLGSAPDTDISIGDALKAAPAS